ncbi:hypothetical protein BDP27DRAFT_1433097 [Rhodocollybia butyracea]|uniref:Uncharacterized protein n=1 Tax=Rhodocollybia butyracea TaxID=206335 RepID=A0A9P5P7I6_9AGAR|nr:hypothetical protein BDP27DRAFT_1433097 [Rhodocollybia butyracea]
MAKGSVSSSLDPAVFGRLIPYRKTRRSLPSSSSLLTSQDLNDLIAHHHPDPQLLRQLLRDFKSRSTEGKLSTFDRELLTWLDWYPPIRQLVSGALSTVAPPSYAAMLGYTAPLCAHVTNQYLTTEDCSMVVKSFRRGGKTRYVFVAPHQGCQFRMPIPWDGVEKYDMEDYNEDQEDDIDLMGSAYLNSSFSTSDASFDLGEGSAAFQSSPPSSPSTAPGQDGMPSSSPPKPRPLANSSRGPQCFYSESTAKARASPDVQVIADVKSAYKSGIFQKYPSFHPAYNLSSRTLPQALVPYDPEGGEGTGTFQHLQLFDDPVGQAIRALNSTTGLPTGTFVKLVNLATDCPVCLCLFSPNGYALHVGEGSRCMNYPGCPSVPETQGPTDLQMDLALRTYQYEERPAFREGLDSAAGRPYLEWNSRLGVPSDVWALVSTAITACPTCRLVRTFYADRLHRSTDGACMDPGRGEELGSEVDLVEDKEHALALTPCKGKDRV